MTPLTREAVAALLRWQAPPCLSVYMPAHRANPDALQDPIRFKNLVRTADELFAERAPGGKPPAEVARLHALLDDRAFWQHQGDGLAVFAADGLFEVFRLARTMPERVVVADSFHLKPLLRVTQSADRFHVLALDRAKCHLYEGDRDSIGEVRLPDSFPATVEKASGAELTKPYQDLAAGAGKPGVGQPSGPHAETAARHGDRLRSEAVDADTERFFRAVDREVSRRYSAPSDLPLVLVALPEHQAAFRSVGHNRHLLPDGVEKHPSAFATPDALRAAVWPVLRPRYEERLATLTDQFRAAAHRGLGPESVGEVAAAVAAYRVGTLLVDADRVVPGRFDPATGEVTLGESAGEDVLDDLAEETARRGGEVVVVPSAAMPTTTGLAAVCRF